jgi:phosphopantothenoylcysteine decarboxylase/phosphopantothenate--cysteine ligase
MAGVSEQNLLLGVSGGIAAYKSADLVRQLRAAGARVRVVMTRSATAFVTPQTFQALSGEPVWSDWSDDRTGMDHIELARWASRILIAPATADCLARLAQGRADDLLAAVCLASSCPLCVAPAMNQAMWLNPATQHNIALLRQRNVQIWGPAEGEQACGEHGPGRMLEPAQLVLALQASFAPGPLAGVRAVVTAGPTREPIDAVRFLSNRSSGKMGFAVARALHEAGAAVELVSGPVALESPPGVHCTPVESAQEMLDAVVKSVTAGCDLFVGAAAVADYRPGSPATEKIKKTPDTLSLQLEPVPDILARVAKFDRRPFCVGFAAETAELERNAQHKLISKGADVIAANLVGTGLGFEADDNELLVVWDGGSRLLPRDSKTKLASSLVDCIAELYLKRLVKDARFHKHAEYSA